MAEQTQPERSDILGIVVVAVVGVLFFALILALVAFAIYEVVG